MQKGDVFTKDGTKYSIKQIFLGGENGGRVDASKFKDGKLQKGRPCKFTVAEVKGLLGESGTSDDEDETEDSFDDVKVNSDGLDSDNDDSDPSWEDTRDNREVVEDLINTMRESGADFSNSDSW